MKKNFYLILWAVVFLMTDVQGQYNADQSPKFQTYRSNNTYNKIDVPPIHGKKIKNVILMIGDGMGLQHFYTAWSANKGQMNIENCTSTGLVKTYCANKLITDSGAAGTAMAIGSKANYYAIGLSANNDSLPSLVDLAKRKSLGTGIVVTCNLTDATPSAFVAKNENRNNEQEIALGYLKGNADFVFGGDNRHFINRADNRNLLQELSTQYQVCETWEEVAQKSEGRVFAVLGNGQLPLAQERKTLWRDGVKKSIEILSKNKQGFFLMLEGSRIDDCGHANNVGELVEEIFDFDKGVGDVLQFAAKNKETLVVILSDHETGGLTLTGGDKTTGEVRVHFSTGNHSGVMIPVYAYGPGAEQFTGIMENTDIFHKIKKLLNL